MKPLRRLIRCHLERQRIEKEEKELLEKLRDLLEKETQIVLAEGKIYSIRWRDNFAEIAECEGTLHEERPMLSVSVSPALWGKIRDAYAEVGDESLSQWAEQVLAGAYVDWLSGKKLPADPGAEVKWRRKITLYLSRDLMEMVREVADAHCKKTTRPEKGPSLGAAIRILFARALS